MRNKKMKEEKNAWQEQERYMSETKRSEETDAKNNSWVVADDKKSQQKCEQSTHYFF